MSDYEALNLQEKVALSIRELSSSKGNKAVHDTKMLKLALKISRVIHE